MANVYYTGKPCKHGHIANRYTASRQCVVCHSISQERRRQSPEGRAVHHARVKEWAAKNPEKVRGYKNKYVENNRETVYERNRQRIKANPETRKETLRKHAKKYKALYTAKSRERQVKKRLAMPPWVDRESVELIYIHADYISRLTQIHHEVDHIVPLQNTRVCGLHVPWNLQIIPMTENRRKANIFQGYR
jgi:hypothetical protein